MITLNKEAIEAIASNIYKTANKIIDINLNTSKEPDLHRLEMMCDMRDIKRTVADVLLDCIAGEISPDLAWMKLDPIEDLVLRTLANELTNEKTEA